MRTMIRTLLLLAAAIPVLAQAEKKPSDITVEEFFKRPDYQQMRLSPNGKYLAAIVPLNGRNNLAVIDIDSKDRKVVTDLSKLDISQFWWVSNKRLCIRLGDAQQVTGQFTYRGTYCLDRDGDNVRDFSNIGVPDANAADSFGGRRTIAPYRRLRGDTDEYIVEIRLRSIDSADVYRFNTRTGRYTLLSDDSPGNVRYWILDWKDVPRIAVSQPQRAIYGTTRTVWYRDGEGAKWQKVFETEMTGQHGSNGEFEPLQFDADNSTLYVSYRPPGRDKAAIYTYDTTAKKVGEVAFEHPLIDLERGLVWSRAQNKLMGLRYNADRPGVLWLDEKIARLQKSIDAALPSTTNDILFAGGDQEGSDEGAMRVLVFAHSDRDPGEYYLMDGQSRKLQALVRTRSWIDPSLMAERKFIRYKARDGMEIPAWITIPQGGGKNLPLVVHVHGGPQVRGYQQISWGRWPDAQFFASRGYLVLEPEPRGSTGYGDKLYTSSFKQWGQSMQDDITDGAMHLVKEGLADKSRMCIIGGSYGGYASAMAVVKDPDVWKCAVPYVAVTDLTLMQTVTYSDISMFTDYLQTEFKKTVGDSDADKGMFDKYSPARHADRVKAPVLIAMGSDDRRVPQVHGDKFVSALQSAGKKVEYVVYPGEGHGFNKDENVSDWYHRIEKFFAENLKK